MDCGVYFDHTGDVVYLVVLCDDHYNVLKMSSFGSVREPVAAISNISEHMTASYNFSFSKI